MSTLFTKIINGDIPCVKIAENEGFFAFMDINPTTPGHTLVIPKQEVDEFFDLDDHALGGIMPFAQPIATALKKVFPCQRIGVLVAGLEVPHAHVHLIPITTMGDMDLGNAQPADATVLAEQGEKIRAALEGPEG